MADPTLPEMAARLRRALDGYRAALEALVKADTVYDTIHLHAWHPSAAGKAESAAERAAALTHARELLK